jgi:uncharacterized membrane protein YqjE
MLAVLVGCTRPAVVVDGPSPSAVHGDIAAQVVQADTALASVVVQIERLPLPDSEIAAWGRGVAADVATARAAIGEVARHADKLAGVHVQHDAMAAELAQWRGDSLGQMVTACWWAVFAGLVIGAAGGASLLVPSARQYGLPVAAFGGLLLAGGSMLAVSLPSLVIAAQWVVYAVASVILLMLLLGSVWAVWRVVRYMRDTGPIAQIKLLTKGDVAGAAAAAFAAAGGGDAGKAKAKSIKAAKPQEM